MRTSIRKYNIIKYMNCAPNRKGDKTCYTKMQLEKMADILNKQENAKIKGKTKEQLWNGIREHLFEECNYEWCWLDNKSIKQLNDKELKEMTFKPAMPEEWMKNKYTWLTTTDINKVMRQYENLYEDFRFFGPVPVDCPKDIYCELTNIDLGKLRKRNVKNIGVIFNLDKHNESGSHWVALYVDGTNNRVSYYDSTGSEPPGYIRYFMEMMRRQMPKGVKVDWNKKKHQFGGSECGVYSMNFLVESLKGKSLRDFEKKSVSDFSVNILRNYFYRPSKKSGGIGINGGKNKKK